MYYLDKDHVPLDRFFSPIPKSEEESILQQIPETHGGRRKESWDDLDKRFRTVVLAEAGAGKSHEMYHRAKIIDKNGHHAFLILIEDIVKQFKNAFRVGNLEEFDQWLSSDNEAEAWFFLDSVDEARLSNPKDFEKVIIQFSDKIKSGLNRAHICISSRPYAWRPKLDRKLIEYYLPFERRQEEADEQNRPRATEIHETPDSKLEVFWLNPLNENNIRQFAEQRSTPNINKLISELEHSRTMYLAERPFDLKTILDKWKTDSALGSRSELFRYNIESGLEEHPDKIHGRELKLAKARKGAEKLAAAVILCNEPGIRIPDETNNQVGIKADAVLSDWLHRDIQTLLERAVFNDVIYDTVRFRHRQIREYLAAEWFYDLLKRDTARHKIERLIFREQYGQVIIAPRLRPILPWLILQDDIICHRALDLHPEIIFEGGDPAGLPLSVRKKILKRLIDDIVSERKSYPLNNDAIAMIAQLDLEDETIALIKIHNTDDNAIFHLGRLVWQGKFKKCIPPLLDIAINPKRGRNARIVAVRSVMNCGSDEQRSSLWEKILIDEAEIPRELLAELLQGLSTDQEGVTNLLKAIEKLPPFDRFKVTWLVKELHEYIERLPISNSVAFTDLIYGLQKLLERSPHIEHSFLDYRISQEYQWLLNPALHAIERLISVRDDASLHECVLDILLNAKIIQKVDQHYHDYKGNLSKLIPAWPELNDTLFWRVVHKERKWNESRGMEPQYHVSGFHHYWSFRKGSLTRVIDWINSCESEDDQLVALYLAMKIFSHAECPKRSTGWLDKIGSVVKKITTFFGFKTNDQDISFEKIRLAVKGNTLLETQLNSLLEQKLQHEHEEFEQEKQREEEEKRYHSEYTQPRSEWVEQLKADPDIVRNPQGLQSGQVSQDQIYLMRAIEEGNYSNSMASGSDWRFLIKEFGECVALAYRDTAMVFWREYDPGLPSEGTDCYLIPPELQFAMSGLEIEASENNNFPEDLSESEFNHVLRYIFWEVNGFPSWFEATYKTNPLAVKKIIWAELKWELENKTTDQINPRLLEKMSNWLQKELRVELQKDIAPPTLNWIQNNDPSNDTALHYCLDILRGGVICSNEIADLAKKKVGAAQSVESNSRWYSEWVYAQPDTGIPAFKKWLSELDDNQSSCNAQNFITKLMKIQLHSPADSNINLFRSPKHLKDLYLLMHEYIRLENDTDRAKKGADSSTLLARAQDDRHGILKLLAEIPGKETYVALKELAECPPHPNFQKGINLLAFKRVEADGDLEPWNQEHIVEFESDLTITPTTQKQLYDQTVDCLLDLKNWVERGDTSPYVTWKKAEIEPEMRILIVGYLELIAKNRFTVAQEDELANSQRVDIKLNSQYTGYPIPIELKLLDNWSGPNLLERLEKQLAKDYLRDGDERCGVMLLVWQGKNKPNKKWKIYNKLTTLLELQDNLQECWNKKIANSYRNISCIEVIVIDLTIRAFKS